MNFGTESVISLGILLVALGVMLFFGERSIARDLGRIKRPARHASPARPRARMRRAA